MENFWDFRVWGSMNLIAVLLLSLLAANMLKRTVKFFQASLIPTSVFGGAILIVISSVYKLATGEVMFDTAFFGGNGTTILEIITYHALALGFIASTFKTSENELTKKRTVEILNTGCTTVSTYLMQAILGMSISLIAALLLGDFFPAAGVLLPFGYGQGTGQAMNYGNIYETQFGFAGGKSFGLSIAALGFISSGIGGIIHLSLLRKKGVISKEAHSNVTDTEQFQSDNEIPMQENLDKLTVQVALVVGAYLLTFLVMYALGSLLPNMKAVIFGFNFLLGVISATLIKGVINFLYRKKGVIHRNYISNFLMTRTSNFCYDVMVVAGIAAIRLSTLKAYLGVIMIMGVVGALSTYYYNYYVAKKLFPEYCEEQFLVMYGMLTGTASTGIMLLREIDGEFRTPAANNLVLQNFPAIVLGFPMMLLATVAPEQPVLCLAIFIALFLLLNLLLFRSVLFKKKCADRLAHKP